MATEKDFKEAKVRQILFKYRASEHIPGTDKSNPKDTKHNEGNPAPGCGKPGVSTPKQQRRYSPKR